jgi:hypothetical protein
MPNPPPKEIAQNKHVRSKHVEHSCNNLLTFHNMAYHSLQNVKESEVGKKALQYACEFFQQACQSVTSVSTKLRKDGSDFQ